MDGGSRGERWAPGWKCSPLVRGHLCLVPDAPLAKGAVVTRPTASSWSLPIPGAVRTWLLCGPRSPACGLGQVSSPFVS